MTRELRIFAAKNRAGTAIGLSIDRACFGVRKPANGVLLPTESDHLTPWHKTRPPFEALARHPRGEKSFETGPGQRPGHRPLGGRTIPSPRRSLGRTASAYESRFSWQPPLDAARRPRDEKTKNPTHRCHDELTTRQLLTSNPLRLGHPLRLCDKIEAISITYRSNPAIFIAVI